MIFRRALALLPLAFACGTAEPNDPPLPTGHTEGSIAGTVSTFGADDRLDIVAGARVVANGIERTTDAYGRFQIDGIPTDAPISIMVRGPASDGGELYADNRIIVRVPSDSGLITPDLHLLRACSFSLDGAAGSGGPVTCTGDDRASFDFPAGSIASQHVGVHVAVLDGENTIDRLGFPEGNSDSGVAILGGVSVELIDAERGGKLQVDAGSSVTVRFELASTDLEGDLQLQWFDDGSGNWLQQPEGRVIARGDRSFYEFEATHFSSYRTIKVIPAEPDACITFTPAICGQAGCERSVWVSLVDFQNRSLHRGSYGPTGACIPTFAGHEYWVNAQYLDPTTNLGPTSPIYARSQRVVPQAPSNTPYQCTADCTDLGRVELTAHTPGCATGTFMTACGPACTEAYSGPLDVFQRGQRVASVVIAPECGGDVCIPLPLDWDSTTIDLSTPSGHQLSFEATASSRGEACGSSACSASPKCQDLGTALLSCGIGLGDCLEADFVATPVLGDPTCGVAAPHRLILDASPTIGPAATFEWKISELDDAGMPRFIDAIKESVGHVERCLPQGVYRVVLTAATNSTFHLPVFDTISQEVSVGVQPVELSIVATPGAIVAPGTQVTLTVVTPDDISQYTFFWWRGSADDPSRVGEGTSVTVSPMGTSQIFGVFASKNGVRVGQAQIEIQVDTSQTMYVAIEATELSPIPDQPVTFRPTSIDPDQGVSDVVTCIFANITAVHWLLTDLATGQQETTDFVAPAGDVLACDRTINGPILERRFPQGNFRVALSIESSDGKTGNASLDLTVDF